MLYKLDEDFEIMEANQVFLPAGMMDDWLEFNSLEEAKAYFIKDAKTQLQSLQEIVDALLIESLSHV